MNSSQNHKSNIRSFICIDFSDEVIKEVARIQSLLEKRFIGKFTELENLHLTLKFLGEISPEILEKVKSSLSAIQLPIFEAHLEDIGTFSIKNNPRILWIKIAGKPIYELQKQIDLSLSPLFKPEERFMSHLTIARIKYIKDKEYFSQTLKNITVKKIKFPISSFKLKSSDLKPMGPFYTTIEEYKLL